MSSSEFDTDTAVTRDPANAMRWLGNLTDRWDIGDKPNGGYVLATAARAMAEAVPTHPHPFSITAHYLRPSESGPCAIDTAVVREGRKLATVQATLSQNGKEKIVVLGTFGDLAERHGPTSLMSGPPELPSPEECARRQPSDPQYATISRIAERTETFLHPDTGFVRGVPSGHPEVRAWTSFSDGRAADALSLLFFADALPPCVFEVLPERGWVPTIELTVHVRRVPAPGRLRARMTTRFLVDGYFEEDGELWDAEGHLVALSRQLGMIFRP